MDAGIVSLRSRTIAAASVVQQSLAACEWLLAQGCSQIVFKVCSIFDSTSDGNIGPVAAALATRLGEDQVIVVPRSLKVAARFIRETFLSRTNLWPKAV